MLGHHHHHGHDDGHHHGHDHGQHEDIAGRGGRLRRIGRFGLAGLIAAAAAAAACLTTVGPGEALVVTAFGDPVRVVTEPGLALHWPAPFASTIPVDVRLRTTSTGLHDVGTRDGLRILVQAYVEWRVPRDANDVTRYLRSVRNMPDEAAEQLRSYAGSSLEVVAAQFDLAQLVNTDPSKVRLDDFEAALKARMAPQVGATYGIDILQVGIERLTLPSDTLEATVTRMNAERNTVADRVTAEGERAATKVRAEADRDARIVVADAHAEAARVEAQSRLDAANIYARSYAAAPDLYVLLRSLDTLGTIVGDNTRLVLRTDAAPFRALDDVPAAPAPTSASPVQATHERGAAAGSGTGR